MPRAGDGKIPAMSGRTLLFVHALLGTTLIIVVQYAEEAAQDSLPSPWLKHTKYIMWGVIFLALWVLDYLAERWQERRARSLKEAGKIEGCWLEKTTVAGKKTEYDLGAFITIVYMAESQFFRIEGEVFGTAGERFGYFSGHGRADALGTKLLYDYEAKHGKKKDDGTGSFAFRQIQKKQATSFAGSFHGTTTKMVRLVDGVRTDPLPENLEANALLSEKQKRVVSYLSQT